MKLLLTSAGLRNQEISKALADLVGKPLTECSIIHLPTAANTEVGDKTWVIDDLLQIKEQHFKMIDLLDVAAVSREVWQPHLDAADIISVGGGNDVYLSQVFEKVGMKSYLTEALKTKVYMGTSAGSMVAGQLLSAKLIELVYPEEAKLTSEPQYPLGFYDFAFIPHLNSEWFSHVRVENLEKLRDSLTHSVYATDDETALIVAGGEVQVVGTGSFWSSAA